MLAADSKLVPAGEGNAFLAQPSPLSWKEMVRPVEPFLDAVNRQLAEQVQTFDPGTVPYADYALNGQGKHLRPVLVALAAKALGNLQDAHVTVAVIIEMVHLATLVHDDVIDEAELRRGRLTLASRWGNEIAVLFGDCLFARALSLAASFPTPEVCRAVANATNVVCSGEIRQTQQRGDFNVSRDDYFRILGMKTGELFALSSELSACLSGAEPGTRAALRSYGMAFGIAYQIFDDCIDLFGTEARAGKSLGTDLAKGKLTLPLLLAWERSGPEDRERLRRAVENPEGTGLVTELLGKCDALTGSMDYLREYLRQARQALQMLPGSRGRAGLIALTDYLARETDALGAAAESSP